MNIEVTELSEILVAGIVARTNNSNERDPKRAQLPKTWERAGKKQYKGLPTAILTDYEGDSNGYYTEVIGHEVKGIEELKPEDVLAKILSGKYAKFSVSGEMPEIVLEAWRKVWESEADGSIKRLYTTDLERYPNSSTIELYIAIN